MTDKAPSSISAVKQLESEGLINKIIHRKKKYLNNLIEQDHRIIKRRCKYYKSLRTANLTIKGMETIKAICKENRRNLIFDFSVIYEINNLLKITN